MGVSGAGKSTVASALAARLGWYFLEADDLHPAANVAKMRAGQPLTDVDRAPWLQAIAERLLQLTRANVDVVLACSVLKVAYRQVLRQERGDWLLIYLKADPDELHRRLAGRKGHYMPPALLDSQLSTLEEPTAGEHALVLDSQGSAEDNLALALAAIRAAVTRQRAGA